MERFIKTGALCIRATAIDYVVKKEQTLANSNRTMPIIQFFIRGNSTPNILPFEDIELRDLFYERIISDMELSK